MQDDAAALADRGWTRLGEALDPGDATLLAEAVDRLRTALVRGVGHPDRACWHYGLGLAMAATAEQTDTVTDWHSDLVDGLAGLAAAAVLLVEALLAVAELDRDARDVDAGLGAVARVRQILDEDSCPGLDDLEADLVRARWPGPDGLPRP